MVDSRTVIGILQVEPGTLLGPESKEVFKKPNGFGASRDTGANLIVIPMAEAGRT